MEEQKETEQSILFCYSDSYNLQLQPEEYSTDVPGVRAVLTTGCLKESKM